MQDGKLRRAAVVGFDYYGRFLANLINEFSSTWQLSFYGAGRMDTLRASIAAANADAIISFGGPSPSVSLVEIARVRRIPIIVIWAGTDVLTAKSEPQLLEVIKRYGFTNISDGPWLVDELRDIGIEATYVPVTAVKAPANIAPLPERFSVISYLPEPRRTFYGEKLVYSIARQFPDVPFRIVGKGGPNAAAPPNVEFLGYVNDMPARIDDSSVLLRLPEHDGKSMLVLEALARGRHVIWNHDLPGVHYVANEADAVKVMRELKHLHEAGKLQPNCTAQHEVRERFSRERLAREFEAVLNEAKPVTPRVRPGQRRVAISGLNLFVAQVARDLERHQVGWSPQILRANVRLEVLTSLLTLIGCDVWYSIGAPISDRWLHLFARLMKKPRVVHWVGSDIIQLYSDRRLQAFCRRPNVRNLAEVDWTIAELASLGIKAELAPLPPRLHVSDVQPLPKRFTILLYLPKTRGEFYGRREYERLIRALGDRVHFIIVGGGEIYSPPGADVERLGWHNSLDEVYRRSTLLIRFTNHDGLSLMTLEALTQGRYVLWSQDFPYVTNIRSYDDIERNVLKMLEAHERGELQPQYLAARYVGETYSVERCVSRLANHWNDAASTQALHPVVTESLS